MIIDRYLNRHRDDIKVNETTCICTVRGHQKTAVVKPDLVRDMEKANVYRHRFGCKGKKVFQTYNILLT